MDDELLKLAIRARPKNNRVLIVSDSLPTIGGQDQFNFYGRTVVLKNERLIGSEGSLAGSQITIAETVEFFIIHLRLEPSEVFKMASTVPAGFIGRDDLAMIDGRLVSDHILLSPAFAHKSRLAEALNAPVSSSYSSKI